MTLSIAIYSIALTALMATSLCNAELDTNRDAKIFTVTSARKGGYTLDERMNFFASSQMALSPGATLKATADLKADSQLIISNLSRGGQKVEFTLTEISTDVDALIFNLHCDSNSPNHSPDCADIDGLVGFTETLVVDSEGNIVRVSGPDGVELMDHNVQSIISRFSGSQHLETHSQLMNVVPGHPVTPGDTWEDDFDFGQLGAFTGTGTLKGYMDYKGSDCAVFTLEGDLHMDMTMVAGSLLLDPSDLPFETADAQILVEIYWDYVHELARMSQMNISTAFDMQNPVNPNDPTKVHVPVELMITTGTDIVKAPGPTEVEAAVEAPSQPAFESPSQPASAESKPVYVSAPEPKTEKAGGFFGFTALVLILVVTVGAAAYVVWSKKSESMASAASSEMMTMSRTEPIYSPLV